MINANSNAAGATSCMGPSGQGQEATRNLPPVGPAAAAAEAGEEGLPPHAQSQPQQARASNDPATGPADPRDVVSIHAQPAAHAPVAATAAGGLGGDTQQGAVGAPGRAAAADPAGLASNEGRLADPLDSPTIA